MHVCDSVKRFGFLLCLMATLLASPRSSQAGEDTAAEANATDSQPETKESVAPPNRARTRGSILRLRTGLFVRQSWQATSRVWELGTGAARLLLKRRVLKPARNILLGSALVLSAHENIAPPGEPTAIRYMASAAEQYFGPTVSRQVENLRKVYQPRRPSVPGVGAPAQPSAPQTQFSKLRDRAVQHVETSKQRYTQWRSKYFPKPKLAKPKPRSRR